METCCANNPQSLFRKYAKDLLWMVNTEAGKYLIGANSKERITKVFHNGYEICLGKQREKYHFISRFNTWSTMERIFVPLIEKIRIANEYKSIENTYEAMLHYSDLHRKSYKYPYLYLTTETYTANGGGQGRIGGINATYATIHDAITATVASAETRPSNLLFGGNYEIQRGFAPFDSSALPNNATITSGVNTFIRAVGSTSKSDADTDSVSVVVSTQASNTALVGEDYDNVGTTKFATDITIANWTLSGNNDFQLNASGITNISLTGYSLFAWRTAKDISNTTPSGNTGVTMVDNTNLLSVEYTLPAAGVPFLTLLGVGT